MRSALRMALGILAGASNVLVACASTTCPTCPSPAPSVTVSQPAVAPARELPVLVEADLAPSPWRRQDAVAAGFDPAALSSLIAEAEATGSDALLILRDGKTIVERTFGHSRGPIETMSVTKSIVGLAVGMLIEEGKIRDIDAPVSTWFPAWKEGNKSKVTVRHLLTQTSGLAHRKGAGVLFQQSDMLAFALSSQVIEEPGIRFSYNNEATMILSGVIREAAGQPVDAYLKSRLFEPLGIEEWSWTRDSAGNVHTLSGLSLTARDLAKIGVMMLEGGRWGGKQIVPAGWVEASTRETVPDSGYGLLWWLRYGPAKRTIEKARLDQLAVDGFGGVQKLTPLEGRTFLSNERLWMEVGALLSDTERADLEERATRGQVPYREAAPAVIGYAADGWLGQALIVMPGSKVVAVRQHRAPKEGADDAYNKAHGFFELHRRLARALVHR